MASYSTANGSQQVSVYPYQQLKSAYANSLFQGIFPNGVYNANVTIGQTGTNLIFTIAAGTTMFFQRQDTTGTTQDFIVGKIVLGSAATVSVPTATIWSTGGTLWNNGAATPPDRVAVVADWTYDITQPALQGVNFTVVNEVQLDIILASQSPTSTGSKLVIAIILNNPTYYGQAGNTPSLLNYHISYEQDPYRNTLPDLHAEHSFFRVAFDNLGAAITVGSGNVLIKSKMIYFTGASIATPYLVTVSYDPITNAPTTTVPSSSLYQVDFLRLKMNENTETVGLYWDSYVRAGTPSLTFGTGPIPPNNILAYLTNYQFPIVGDGITVLIAVRPTNLVPTSGTNPLWPDNCILPKGLFQQSMAPYTHGRLKIPVRTSIELGY